jgi:hypothetical protein
VLLRIRRGGRSERPQRSEPRPERRRAEGLQMAAKFE